MRQERPADARVHFAAAQKLAADEDLKGSAGQAVARLDSVIADRHAADAFERGVRAWKAGDLRVARSHFDSTKALALSAQLRAAATEASSNAGAHLELDRGIAAARKSAWAEAIAAFQHAVALAKDPELKSRAEKLPRTHAKRAVCRAERPPHTSEARERYFLPLSSSTTSASVVSTSPPSAPAFCSAQRATWAGSTMPARSSSPYSPVSAS